MMAESAIIMWAEGEDLIRVLLLTGSRAKDGKSDELSDFDIAIFSRDSTSYTTSDSWLSAIGIGKPWVCVHEELVWGNRPIPTRLVIFEPGVKIDFAFYPLEALTALPEEFSDGYHVLLDKDRVAEELPEPIGNGFKKNPPSEKEFHRVIEEFWFEVYHVAKYLVRGDLWSVKFRDNGLKQAFLLPMIRWHEQAKHQWNYSTHDQGKRMHEWVEEETWTALQRCFSHFDAMDSWRGLHETISLFRRLSRETASQLGYSYLEDLDANISSFIRSLE